jgi:hypothetical protein
MASTLLTLLDDIASILDDVATLSKVAMKKTAGVVGDDLALNAEQLVGVRVNRELPVVWAVAKGSAINKLILVPTALVISVLLPMAIVPLLMLGGAFLCFEGFEKLLHKWLHGKEKSDHEHEQHLQAVVNSEQNLLELERTKIRGAVRTDFILSAEIIVISLGTVAEAPFSRQVLVLATIAVLMTVGVYGLVAAIVKLDDAGLALSRTTGNDTWHQFRRSLGRTIVATAPYLLRFISIAGTVAMFTVGGGILIHGVEPLHHAIEHLAHGNGFSEFIIPTLLNLLAGVGVGAVLVGIVQACKKVWRPAGSH